MIMRKENTQKQYEALLKDMINKHCVTMKARLQRFPQKIVKDLPKLNIPDGEIMTFDGQEYKLKAKANECSLVYEKLISQAQPKNYHSFLQNFRAACKGRKDELVKTIYNEFQAQLVKDFTEQKRSLYEAVAIMNAVVRWLKKDNKEKIKKNSQVDKNTTPTPTSDLSSAASDVNSDDVSQSKRDDEDFAGAGEGADTSVGNESAELNEYEKWMEPFLESTIPSKGSFDPDYL